MRDVNAVEQHRELRRIKLDADIALDGDGSTEASGLQSLVEDDKAAVVPGENFHAVSATREEDEVAAGVHVFAPRPLRNGGEPIDAVAHVSRLAGKQDADRAG